MLIHYIDRLVTRRMKKREKVDELVDSSELRPLGRRSEEQ